MTFSIVGLCSRTGQFGCALATSSMAAGSRAPFVGPGIGVVLSQARSDPRLGAIGLKSLENGRTAEEALGDMIASTPHAHWRLYWRSLQPGKRSAAGARVNCNRQRSCQHVGAGCHHEGLSRLAAEDALAPAYRCTGTRDASRRRGLSAALRVCQGGLRRSSVLARGSACGFLGGSDRRAATDVDAMGADGGQLHPAMSGS
jgi:uncharacterized Ntn-hydrolase superfamily protein